MFDVLITGGRIVDGSGLPWFQADVGIRGDRIVALAPLRGAEANLHLDASGKVVAPGFIDAHVHGDLALLGDPLHEPAIRQGVTTYIIGQDGVAMAPASPATLDYMRRYTAGFSGTFDLEQRWSSMADYLACFDRRCALNVACLVPNGNVRMEVMGLETRPPTSDELRRMARLVREAMEQGAVGLSSGLDYIPSRHAATEELIALCREIAPFGGVYVTHMRRYDPEGVHGSMDEVFRIGREAGVPVHISHFNSQASLVLPKLDAARAAGVDVTYDLYCYLAGSSILGMAALPPWIQESGVDATLARLHDPAVRQKLQDWFTYCSSEGESLAPLSPVLGGEGPGVRGSSGPGFTPLTPNPSPPEAGGEGSKSSRRVPLETIRLSFVAAPAYRQYEGWTLEQAARDARLPVGDFVCAVLTASDMAVGCIIPHLNRTEEDVRGLMIHPAHMAGSDGIFTGNCPHPRGRGCFARYLGHHVREARTWTLEQAVQHLSAHAARRYGLKDRGLLREGLAADVVVFDPETIADRSTYEDGLRLAVGVEHVLVNGEPVLRNGQRTPALPGRVLRPGSAR